MSMRIANFHRLHENVGLGFGHYFSGVCAVGQGRLKKLFIIFSRQANWVDKK